MAYSYTYMHLTFALGASYMAMLLTSWVTLSAGEDTHASNDISVGTGTAAVWVKVRPSVRANEREKGGALVALPCCSLSCAHHLLSARSTYSLAQIVSSWIVFG